MCYLPDQNYVKKMSKIYQIKFLKIFAHAQCCETSHSFGIPFHYKIFSCQ